MKVIYWEPAVLPHLISLRQLTPLCGTHGHLLIGVIGLGEIRAWGGGGRGRPLFIHLLSFMGVLFLLHSVLCVYSVQMPLRFIFGANRSFPPSIDGILKMII